MREFYPVRKDDPDFYCRCGDPGVVVEAHANGLGRAYCLECLIESFGGALYESSTAFRPPGWVTAEPRVLFMDDLPGKSRLIKDAASELGIPVVEIRTEDPDGEG